MNDYLITFFKEHRIDWFYQMAGVLVADLFGTDKYYELDIKDVVNERKEVYYLLDKICHRNGLTRRFPIKGKAIMTHEPCYVNHCLQTTCF